MALTQTDLQGALPLIAKGKVRDIYQLTDDSLLFVATDRISAYDVVLSNGVPNKGKILTAISEFWFNHLSHICPHHLITTELSSLPPSLAPYLPQLEGRSMIVRKLKILPIEAIVRGYLTGSAWKEYQKYGTVHGIRVPEGMRESEKFEEPLFTPSTKAEQGEHDENIHPEKVKEIIGEELAGKVQRLAVELYKAASRWAEGKGIVLADTKFEFGVDEKGEVVLVDEVLTPDSSRFWLKSTYEIGRPQDSYDKQFLRDWLTSNKLNGKEGVEMPEEIASKTAEKYADAFAMIVGKKWEA